MGIRPQNGEGDDIDLIGEVNRAELWVRGAMSDFRERRLVSGKPRDVLLADLEKVGDDRPNWRSYYRDPATGEEWCSEVREEGWSSTEYLVRLPRPTPAELVQLALRSPHADEALVASLLLKDEPEWLEPLIDGLEGLGEGASANIWRRIADVTRWASLEHEMNRREILGKNAGQVKADYQHFLDIARRAKRLREEAERQVRDRDNRG